MSKIRILAWFVGVFAFLFLACLQTTSSVQIISSLGLLAVLYVCYVVRRRAKSPALQARLRLIVTFIGVFFSCRYIHWRAFDTLPLHFGIVSMVLGLLLLMAESYGFLNAMFGFFINSYPIDRKPKPWPADLNDLPTVDVYIPTYNEQANILRPTVIAATQLRYPPEKLRIYLLDDGGTLQKCNDPDPVKAQAARKRASELQEVAATFGATYLTRAKNENAKAGNINSALTHTNGELLLILDCDHIPTADFLEMTVGLFSHEPKLFVVQTPHNFVSPDPLERNLATFSKSPAENELFYDVMQPGLDSWGTSFFCGSAAILRRSVIDKLGGIAGQTITEDAETTLDAMGLGYSSAYFNRPMVSGLQPETYSGFIVQRVRWGQGMLQIFLLKNPWRLPGLTFVQRLLYTNFAIYWGFGASRLAMLIAPPAFLLFAVNLCDATAQDLLIYAGPNLLASLLLTQYFYGRVRWPFMSQLYEIIQAVYVTRGMVEVLLRPRSPSFQVTPKGETLDREFVSSLSGPFYWLLALNVAGLIGGVSHYLEPNANHGALLFVLFWGALDLILLLGALGIMFERRQLRSEPRSLCNVTSQLQLLDGTWVDSRVINASANGMGLRITGSASELAGVFQHDEIRVKLAGFEPALQCRVRVRRWIGAHELSLGLSYDFSTEVEERTAIALAFGSSEQLIVNNAARHSGRSILQGFVYLLRYAVLDGLGHLLFLLKSISRKPATKMT